MDIYIVKGMAWEDNYSESVEVLEGMIEKPKSFVGFGRKINKNKVNKVDEGIFKGSFQVVVLDLKEINEARKIIKEQILEYHMKEYKKLQQIINSTNKHDLNSDIKFKKY